MKDHPRVKAILPKVLDYNQQRQILGLHDYQVSVMECVNDTCMI